MLKKSQKLGLIIGGLLSLFFVGFLGANFLQISLLGGIGGPNTDRLFELLEAEIAPQDEQTLLGEYSIKDIYLRLVDEEQSFVEKQTKQDYERRLRADEREEKESLPAIADEAKRKAEERNIEEKYSALRKAGCPGILNTTENVAVGGTLADITSAKQDALSRCRQVFDQNVMFANTLSQITHQGRFTNQNVKDSGFDLIADLNDIDKIIFGKPEKPFRAPAWIQELSDPVKYLMGRTTIPVFKEDTASQEIVDEVKAETTFLESGTGASFKQLEKDAVVKKLAEFTEAREEPDPTFGSNLVLQPKSEEDIAANIANWVENTRQKFPCNDVVCLKLDFDVGLVGLADSRADADASIRKSVDTLLAATKELAGQNLQLKTSPRAMFSFTFHDLELSIKPQIIVKWVPVLPVSEEAKLFTKNIVKNAQKMYQDFVKEEVNGKDRSFTTPGVSASEQSVKNKEQEQREQRALDFFKKSQHLLVQMEALDDYEKMVGGQLDQMFQQLQTMLQNIQGIKTNAHAMASLKVLQDPK